MIEREKREIVEMMVGVRKSVSERLNRNNVYRCKGNEDEVIYECLCYYLWVELMLQCDEK